MNTLPLNWAVEIPSPQDAQRLQALFPEEMSWIGESIMSLARYGMYKLNNDNCLSKNFDGSCIYPKLWGFASKPFYLSQGYTIYTITELETILNER